MDNVYGAVIMAQPLREFNGSSDECRTEQLAPGGRRSYIYMHHLLLLIPKADTHLSYHDRKKAESNWMVAYILKWFSCPQTITHSSSNRSGRRATSLIETDALTTTPRRRHASRVHENYI